MDWWKQKNGILQIYPRSFKDSNADGVGDLQGIIEKLPYLKGEPDSLGIDAIWLSPFYTSPMADFGYDVSDHCDVDPIFGNIADFKQLVIAAHEREIAVMIDIVPNHTSDKHPWFVDAIASLDSEKRDYFIFRDGKDGQPPNNWLSVFGGSAWRYNEDSAQYYLHSFLAEQPDLNWHNPAVQDEFRKIISFWCELGVDGFRVDAVRWMGKNLTLEDDDHNSDFNEEADPYDALKHNNSRYGPELDGYLRVLTDTAKSYGDKVVLFEDYLDDHFSSSDQIIRMYGIDPTVGAPFNFEVLNSDGSSRELAGIIAEYEQLTPDSSASIYCLGNHDKPRLISRMGMGRARVLATIQLTLPGIPVLYYGEEIGMSDAEISEAEVHDPFEKRVPGKGLGRDPARTPMQWDKSHNAGFSDAENAWLPIHSNFMTYNVADERTQSDSFLKLYQELLLLRKREVTLRTGSYREAYVDDDLFMFARDGIENQFLIVANLSGTAREVELPPDGEVVCQASTVYPTIVDSGSVREIDPFDSLIVRYP